ncbi:MAG: hypothetical protein Q4F71_06725 [Paracoccus sp. (in: a-proteobacteria)]|nr:hypothetical protein [Paracoccus sp. (in: a-proteobacteria)]
MEYSDEDLMALADGELDAAEAARIEAAAKADPALAARIAQFRDTRAMLARAYPLKSTGSGEDRLAAMIRGAQLASGEGARPGAAAPRSVARPANMNWRPAAVAAGLALVVLGGFWMWKPGPDDRGVSYAAVSAPVAAALGSVPSGFTAPVDGAELTVIASYRNAAGELCREYETRHDAESMLAVACHAAPGWENRFTAAIEAAGADYVPASGALEDLDAYLAESGAGETLTASDEAEALAALR